MLRRSFLRLIGLLPIIDFAKLQVKPVEMSFEDQLKAYAKTNNVKVNYGYDGVRQGLLCSFERYGYYVEVLVRDSIHTFEQVKRSHFDPCIHALNNIREGN